MTSKEKIREILSVYHEYAKCYDEDDEWNKVDFNYDGETFRIFEEDVEKVKEIIKDLEILEIIKRWSFLDTFYREDTDTTYDRFLCNIHTKGMKEDFEKVEEWLDDK